MRYLLFLFSLMLLSAPAFAQRLLGKTVSVEANKKPLSEVLQSLGRQGGFDFSYNSQEVNASKPVTLSAKGKTVKQVLDMIFEGSFTYKETRSHIVLQAGKEKFYYISGYVVDASTGERIPECSIYEKQQLASAMTDKDGYFRVRMRSSYDAASLMVSKESFNDLEVPVRIGLDQEFRINMQPVVAQELPEMIFAPESGVEKTWLGKMLLSSRQRIQSLNIGKYFTDKPYQVSLLPGAGTHGQMGAQVVNKFSMNVLGGYTAGSNGFEIGGIFNIDKKDVRYAQIAGIFNIVGGKMEGVQVGGIYNQVLDSVRGVQVAGISNYVNGSVDGVQIGGIGNIVTGSMDGVQIGGIHNVARNGAAGLQIAGINNLSAAATEGVQVAGVSNFSRGEMKGTQISGVVNYAANVRGTQIGLINISDSSTGYSIGLINIIRKGYHRVCLSSNEVLAANIAVKTGNTKLYSILLAGAHTGKNYKAYSFGYGMGKEFWLSKRLSLTTDVTVQYLYLGNWDAVPMLARIQPSLQVDLGHSIRLFGGPAYSFFYRDQVVKTPGYMENAGRGGFATNEINENVNGWLGWQVGVGVF